MDEQAQYALGVMSRDISRLSEEKALAVSENVILRNKVKELEEKLKEDK